MNTNFIFALDFDGVICDSARETAASGWKACRALWPDRFAGELPLPLSDDFCAVRPVLKTGYESILLLSLLKDNRPISTILSNYIALKNDLLTSLSLSTDELKTVFSSVRDQWINEDFTGWLNANTFYNGTIAAVNRCSYPVNIVTTKQKRFAMALCGHAGLRISQEHVFGLESGPKHQTLATLLRPFPDSTLIFVEDNIQNLETEHIINIKRARRIFADWGYSTPEHRHMAVSAQNVTPITLSQFPNLLDKPGNFLS